MPIPDLRPSTKSLLEHASFLRNVARALLRDGAAADDVVQETYLRAIQAPPAHQQNLRGWLGRVARNLALDRRRSNSRRKHREEVAARECASAAPDVVLARLEAQTEVVAELRALDESYRTVLLLRFFDDLKPREIAARLEMPVSTVNTRLQRGLSHLRTRLDRKPGRKAWVAALAPLLLPKSAIAAGTIASMVSLRTAAIAALALTVVTAATAWQWQHSSVQRAGHRASLDPRDGAAIRAPNRAALGTPATPDAPDATVATGQTIAVVMNVTGTVRSGGVPLQGARVFYASEDGSGGWCETDEEGRYGLFHRGNFEISASHTDYGPVRKKVRAKQIGVAEFDFDLPPPNVARLIVIDDVTGKPVEGATVWVVRAGDPLERGGANAAFIEWFRGGRDIPSVSAFPALAAMDAEYHRILDRPWFAAPAARSDRSGRVKITALPQGSFDAIVMHDDAVAFRLKGAEIGAEPMEVRLVRGGALHVHAPVPEGSVCEVIRAGLEPQPVGAQFVGGNLIGGNQSVEFAHLPPGHYRVVVSAGGVTDLLSWTYSRSNSTESPRRVELLAGEIEIVRGQTAELDLSRETGARIDGVLIRKGEGSMRASVLLIGDETVVAETETDEDGRFLFVGLSPGRYEIHLQLHGGGRMVQHCEVRAGAAAVVVEILVPEASVRGSVFDANGKPLADVGVFVEQLSDADREAGVEGIHGWAMTDEQGRFVVDGLPAGEYRVLSGTDGMVTMVRVRLAKAQQVRCELKLDPATLRRLTIECRPVAAKVFVRVVRGGLAQAILTGAGLDAKSKHELYLPPGRYRVTANAAGHAPAQSAEIDLTVDRNITVNLEVGTELSLRVPPNSLIRLAASTGALLSLNGVVEWRADARGVLVLRNVPAGRFRVSADGKAAGAITVRGAKASYDLID